MPSPEPTDPVSLTAANEAPTVRFERPRDGVCLVALGDPATRNALTAATVAALRTAFDRFDGDPALKVAVLTGRGNMFCSGGDTRRMGAARPRPLERKEYLWSHVQRLMREIHALDKPLIAAISGPAVGAGCDLALYADIRLLASSAYLRISYVDLGVVPGAGGAFLLPRLIGASRALELLWTGRKVEAEEAQRLGLVSDVVADGDLEAAALDLAALIATKPLQSLRLIKRMVQQGQDVSLAAALDAASSHFALLQETEDHAEGLTALRERRTARFSDR